MVLANTVRTSSSRRPRVRSVAASEPEGFDVLVLDSGMRQSLACARSLGRAGLRVTLGECFAECDPTLPVMAFRSRFSARNVVFPSFAVDPDAFAEAVVDYVRCHPTAVVLPASDGAIAALLPSRDRLRDLGCRLALGSDASLSVANDKRRTLDIASGLGIASPATMPIEALEDLPAILAQFEYPAVIKPTTSWVRRRGATSRLHAAEVTSEREAVACARALSAAGAGVLAQQWVGGRREGVTLFLVDGIVHASFAHLEHRTSPALGGASVLRESIAMPADIYEASVKLARALDLEGLCEVEFRRDEHGRPMLMEINARLAGPVETALRCGVNFPLLVWQWAVGLPVDVVDGYQVGVRMRWLRGDLRWLRDNRSRSGRPDSLPRGAALRTFVAEFFRRTRYDCLDFGDLGPILAELMTTVAMTGRQFATVVRSAWFHPRLDPDHTVDFGESRVNT